MSPSNAKKNPQKQKVWNQGRTSETINRVREKKMEYLNAADHFNVHRTTLFRLCEKNDVSPEEAAVTNLGRKIMLGTEVEKHLVAYILAIKTTFCGLTRNDVRRMAYLLAKRNNLENLVGESGMAGRLFHPSEDQQHLALTRNTFFQNNSKTYAARITFYQIVYTYNVDKSGLTVIQSKILQVVGLKRKRQMVSLTTAERAC